jgi:hypothetical protein
LHVDHWSINYVFDDVCTIRIKMTNNKWINIHNVYNASLNFYTTRSALIVIKIVKNCLNDDEKHILLKDFNLHHFLWSDATKSIQHDATNKLLNVVQQTQFKFIFFTNIIIWESRHFQNTIDLIFMTKKLQEEFIHCMTRSKMNQNSNHISIFTKLMIIVKKNESRRRRAWKSISTNKFLNNRRQLVASSSFNCVAQVEVYALKIQQCVLRSINLRFVSKFLFRDQILLTRKVRWSDNDDETSTKRMNYTANRKNLTKLFENIEWKEANHRKKKKKIEFKQVFRIICDSSFNLWRLIRWARIRNHKSRNTSKIWNLSRWNAKNNAFEMTTNFEFKIRLLSNLFLFRHDRNRSHRHVEF